MSASTVIYKVAEMLKEDCDSLATFALGLSSVLEKEVINPLNKLLEEQKECEAKIHNDWHNAQKEYNDKFESLKKIKDESFKAYEKFNEGMLHYEKVKPKMKGIPEIKKSTLKVYQLYVNFKKLEKSYKTKYLDVKNFNSRYSKVLEDALSRYKNMEHTRLSTIQKLTLDYFDKEKKFIQSLKEGMEKNYNIEAGEGEISKAIEEINLNMKELKTLQFQGIEQNHEAITKEFDKLYLNNKILEDLDMQSFKSMFMNSSSENDKEIMENFKQVLTSVWNTGKPCKEHMTKFKELIETENGRSKFCEAFNIYRAQGIFLMSRKGYGGLISLLTIILDEIDKTNDTESALKILILLQTYYTEVILKDGRQVKIFLQQELQKHPLWGKTEFWERAITEGIDDDKRVELPGIGKEEKEIMLKSSIFGKLGTFTQNMLEFGISKKEVTDIIMKHAINNKLPKEFIDNLSVSFEEKSSKQSIMD